MQQRVLIGVFRPWLMEMVEMIGKLLSVAVVKREAKNAAEINVLYYLGRRPS